MPRRVTLAQQLLETTDMSIEWIAAEVGFGTPLALRQQFSLQLGILSAVPARFCDAQNSPGRL